ncbi:MAG: extracellular solute-binding protein [Micromonosporaceae bacterium]|nr:extracellular solute-binding protein [Micromonosporaceae bacterium]
MKSRNTYRFIGSAVLATGMLLTACGGSPTATDPEQGDSGEEAGGAYQELLGLSQDQLVARAQEEGELNFYTAMSSDLAVLVADAFEAEYEIGVAVYRSTSDALASRIAQEQAANYPGNDVVETGGLELAALNDEGLLQPHDGLAGREAMPEEARSDGWTADRYIAFLPNWNTNLVAASEQPTSWEDLADPRWDGRLSLEQNDYDWYATLHTWFVESGKTEAEADQIFEEMARDAKVTNGHSTQANLLTAGQFAVSASAFLHLTEPRIADGEPVAVEPLVEPVIVRPNGVAAMRSAQNPAAALLFVSWLLADGQDVLAEGGVTPALPGKSSVLTGVEVLNVDLEMLQTEGQEWAGRYDRLLTVGEVVE